MLSNMLNRTFVPYLIALMTKMSPGMQNFIIQFPHLTFMHGPRSSALEARMQVAMGAAGERSAGPHTQCNMSTDSY